MARAQRHNVYPTYMSYDQILHRPRTPLSSITMPEDITVVHMLFESGTKWGVWPI